MHGTSWYDPKIKNEHDAHIRKQKKSLSLIYVGIVLLSFSPTLFPYLSSSTDLSLQFPNSLLIHGFIVAHQSPLHNQNKMHAFKDKVTQKLSDLFPTNSPTSFSSSSQVILFQIPSDYCFYHLNLNVVVFSFVCYFQ